MQKLKHRLGGRMGGGTGGRMGDTSHGGHVGSEWGTHHMGDTLHGALHTGDGVEDKADLIGQCLESSITGVEARKKDGIGMAGAAEAMEDSGDARLPVTCGLLESEVWTTFPTLELDALLPPPCLIPESPLDASPQEGRKRRRAEGGLASALLATPSSCIAEAGTGGSIMPVAVDVPPVDLPFDDLAMYAPEYRSPSRGKDEISEPAIGPIPAPLLPVSMTLSRVPPLLPPLPPPRVKGSGGLLLGCCWEGRAGCWWEIRGGITSSDSRTGPRALPGARSSVP